MANLERVIKGTPEQLETILINGSITVNDITITREEIEAGTTLFDTGRLDQMALNQQVKTDMHRLYGYNHTSFAVKDINTVYDEIIEANPALASKSAIGFTALLNSGETVSKQGNRMFIYGKAPESEGADVEVEEEFNDYTFTGEEKELVTVWYFKNGDLPVNYAVNDLWVIEIVVKRSESGADSDFNISAGALNRAKSVTGIGYIPVSVDTEHLTINDLMNSILTERLYIQAQTKTFSLNAKKLNSLALVKDETSPNLKIADFPELEEIECAFSNGYTFQLYNGETEIKMPKLKEIYCWGGAFAVFRGAYNLTLPETLTSVIGTKPIIDRGVRNTLNLDCINLETMPDHWYSGNPPTYLNIKNNWGCSISLANVTPITWDKTNYIDLFTNKLRNMTPTDETRTLKIPTAIYNALTTEEIAIATAKGWTITHP